MRAIVISCRPVELNSTGTLSPMERPSSLATSSNTAIEVASRSSGEPATDSTSKRSKVAWSAAITLWASPSTSARPARIPAATSTSGSSLSRVASSGERPPPMPIWPEVTMKSPVNALSTVLPNDAFVDEAKIVMNVTSPTPIISADAVAAVRLGLRMAFPRQRQADEPAEGERHRPAECGDAEEHEQDAQADDGEGARRASEEPVQEGAHAQREDRRAHDHPLLGAVAGAADRDVAHGGDRWDLAGLAGGRDGRQERDDHPRRERDDRGAGREDDAACGDLEAERGEEALEPGGQGDAGDQPESRGDDADPQRLHQHGGEHLPAGGTEGPQESVLAGPLGNGDEERVEDDEAPDQEGHDREHEHELAEEGEPLLDRVLVLLCGRLA